MDRKGIIAVVLAIGVLFWWTNQQSKEMSRYQEQMRLHKEAEAKKNATPAPVEATAATPGDAKAAAPAITAGNPAAPVEPAVSEKVDEVRTPSVVYRFTNVGGAIRSVALTKHTVAEAAVELNKLSPTPIGVISEARTAAIGDGIGTGSRLPFTRADGGNEREVTYERTDSRNLQITKKFRLPQAGSGQDEYTTVLEVTFTNKGAQPISLPGYFVHTGAAVPMYQQDQPMYTVIGWLHGGDFTSKDSSSFTSGGFLGFGKTDAPTLNQAAADTTWAAVTNQYFTNLVTLTGGLKGNGIWAQRYGVPIEEIPPTGPARKHADKAPAPSGQSVNGIEGAIQLPAVTLAANGSVTHTFHVYTGPREYSRLEKLGGQHELLMDFGIFKWISVVLLNSLNGLFKWFGSYAWAIVVLTIIIRSLMWPLQNKATQSMKNIAALQPKMQELKDKYPDDPTRQQQEIMKLYKQYNINPLMGCLPLLVQIPIFFGFYNMLGKAVELRNAKFLGWVTDLSQPDTVGYILGIPINILPLLMAGTMFVQMHLSPKSGDAVQQRVFMFMPVIFVLFCYNYASALALYWTVQNLFSIVQLWVTRDKITPDLQKVPAPAKTKR